MDAAPAYVIIEDTVMYNAADMYAAMFVDQVEHFDDLLITIIYDHFRTVRRIARQPAAAERDDIL